MTEATLTKEPMMTTDTTPLPLRSDTILGVCEAIGRDFGFNPLWLRLAFIAPLFFQPVATIAAYFLLAGLVGTLHLLFPNHKGSDANTSAAAPATVTGANADEQLAIAA